MGRRAGPGGRHTILVFEHRKGAEEALRALVDGGVPPDRIDFFVRAPFVHTPSGVELQGAIERAGTAGAEIGAIAGLILFVIPGIGPVLGTGSIATALTGAVLGSCFGGVAGALAGAGLSEAEAALAERHLRDGMAVVIVQNEGDLPAVSKQRIEMAKA